MAVSQDEASKYDKNQLGHFQLGHFEVKRSNLNEGYWAVTSKVVTQRYCFAETFALFEFLIQKPSLLSLRQLCLFILICSGQHGQLLSYRSPLLDFKLGTLPFST
jgi:hypothetical protein